MGGRCEGRRAQPGDRRGRRRRPSQQRVAAAAGIAEDGVTDINAAKRDVLAAITDAERDGFEVAEDLTVTDTRENDKSTAAARQTAAAEYAEDIRWTAERLIQTDSLVGERLEAKAAELDGINFDSDGHDPTIQLVDNEFPLQPPTPGDPKDRTPPIRTAAPMAPTVLETAGTAKPPRKRPSMSVRKTPASRSSVNKWRRHAQTSPTPTPVSRSGASTTGLNPPAPPGPDEKLRVELRVPLHNFRNAATSIEYYWSGGVS